MTGSSGDVLPAKGVQRAMPKTAAEGAFLPFEKIATGTVGTLPGWVEPS